MNKIDDLYITIKFDGKKFIKELLHSPVTILFDKKAFENLIDKNMFVEV